MKTLRNAIPALFAALVIALLSTSCNKDDNNPVFPSDTLVDIVTLQSLSENGFTVTLRKENDSPLVTLTFNQKLTNLGIEVGERFLLEYKPESGIAYTSGPATAYAYRPIINGNLLEGTAAEYNHWGTFSVELNSIWRTGEYINIMALCDYVNQPAKFALVVDEATLDSPIPDAYLIFEPDKGVDGSTKAAYASFDIKSIWNDSKYTGLRVFVVTHSGTKRTVFAKDNPDVIQPN